jgi:hypothetical protein
MLKLTLTIQEHNPDTLGHILKKELESGTGAALPLHKGANEGGYCDASNLEVTILSLEQNAQVIRAMIGVFFTEVVANCSCGDEPLEKPAYCEMLLNIDRTTAETDVHVV